MKTKTSDESRTVTSRIIRQNDVNSLGTAHGGYILEWMDTVASICARRHSNRRVNTVAVEELSFIQPLQVGHVAKIVASISRTFRTSMEVLVDVFDEDTINDKLTLAVSGVFIFVGLDGDKPAGIPELLPQTDDEKKLWEHAGKRRHARQQRKRENENQDS